MNPISLGYELKIGRVVDVDSTTNTVNVRLIDRFNHKTCIDGVRVTGKQFQDYGDLLEDVEIRMTTDAYFYSGGVGARAQEAWSMFVPCFAAEQFFNPIYVYVMVSPVPEEPHYIIACFKENQVPIENMSAIGASGHIQFSQRLFPTYTIFVEITFQNQAGVFTRYFWDMQTQSLAATLDAAEYGAISFSLVDFGEPDTTFQTEYSRLFGAIDYATIEYKEGQHGYSYGSFTTSHWLNIGSSGSDTYWQGVKQSDATMTTTSPGFNAVVDVPTAFSDGGYHYMAHYGAESLSFTFTDQSGNVVTSNVSYAENTTIGTGTVTISDIGTINITETGAYAWVRYFKYLSVSIGPMDIHCVGGSVLYTHLNDSKIPHALGSYIYTAGGNKEHSRDTALETFVDSLVEQCYIDDTTSYGNVYMNVVAKPLGVAGDKFGESYTLADVI